MTAEDKITFFEHLRIVHFTLLAACIALFASSLLDGSDNRQKIKEDLNLIKSFASVSIAPKIYNLNNISAATKANDHQKTDLLPYTFKVTANTREPEKFSVPGIRSGGVFYFPGFVDDEARTACAVLIAPTPYQGFVIRLSPDPTLAQFKQFWDCLLRLRFFRVTKLHLELITSGGSEAEDVEGSANSDDYKDEGLEALYTKATDYVQVNKTWSVLYKDDIGRNFNFPVDTEEVLLEQHSLLNGSALRPLAGLAFSNAFVRLNLWAEKKIGRQISVLIEDLQLEVETPANGFEIFGVKFPHSGTATLGIPIILCIQLYFALHLRAFTTLEDNTTPAVCFPWLGVYQDMLSRITFYVTTALIPVSLVSMLLYESWPALHRLFVLSLLLIALVLQIFLLRCIRKFQR